MGRRMVWAAFVAGVLTIAVPLGGSAAPRVTPVGVPQVNPCVTTPSAAIKTVKAAKAAAPDSDGDGISDACEQYLAERYAPIVYHSSDESNYPTNVDWFLPKTSIWFYDDNCTPDLHVFLESSPSQMDLLGRGYTGGCGSSDTVHSDGTWSDHKQRTFYLADLPDQYRIGSLNTSDWTTYYHAYPNTLGGITVAYWRFYAYNDAADNHGGDWEGIFVVLDKNSAVAHVGLFGHTGIDYESPSQLVWEGNHPHIFSEGGGHASHDSGSSINSRNCLGIEIGSINLNDLCTFTRQETWTGGHVQWCKNPRVSVCTGALTSGGRLVDVGEKTMPMNGQVFLRYSGLWGSPGTIYYDSGYWGPAFNETQMGPGAFDTAWCYGMSRPQSVIAHECYPSAISR